MVSLPKIDMLEVTRLTREGRLNDAMTLLKGGSVEDETVHDPEGTSEKTVELKRTGEGWSVPNDDQASAGAASSGASQAAQSRSQKTNLFSAPFKDRLRRTVSPSRRAGPGSTVTVPEGASFAEESFRSNAGTRPFKLYVPSGYASSTESVSLMVMLHGCTQSPDDFALGTGMNELAEEQGFLVLYPGQTRSANASKCWNWFSAPDQQREGGEPEIIAGMVRSIMSEYRIDRKRVFAAGLSAGGAAAAILGQRYPDLFAAIGVHSGLACGAAKDMPSAFSAMNSGGPAPKGSTAIPAIVFQGSSDTTVAPVNAERVASQALGNRSATTERQTGRSDGGVSYTRTIHRDPSGALALENWALAGMGHAWSGGSANGSYTDPKGPDASREMMRFFHEVASQST